MKSPRPQAAFSRGCSADGASAAPSGASACGGVRARRGAGGRVRSSARAAAARPGADRRGRRAVLPASARRAAGAGALCRRRPAAAVLFSGDRARRVGVLPDARPPAPARVFVGFFGNRARFSPDFGSGKNFFEKMPYFFQKVLCKCEKMVYNIQYSAMRAGRIRPGKECREK